MDTIQQQKNRTTETISSKNNGALNSNRSPQSDLEPLILTKEAVDEDINNIVAPAIKKLKDSIRLIQGMSSLDKTNFSQTRVVLQVSQHTGEACGQDLLTERTFPNPQKN